MLRWVPGDLTIDAQSQVLVLKAQDSHAENRLYVVLTVNLRTLPNHCQRGIEFRLTLPFFPGKSNNAWIRYLKKNNYRCLAPLAVDAP